MDSCACHLANLTLFYVWLCGHVHSGYEVNEDENGEGDDNGGEEMKRRSRAYSLPNLSEFALEVRNLVTCNGRVLGGMK